HAAPRPEFLKDDVSPQRPRKLQAVTSAVLQVAERDRLRRTGLLAGGDDVAIPHRPVLAPSPILARDDPLQTHRALLHDAELADGDVRVQLHLEWRGPLPPEPVEAAHLVGAVVATVPGPDAPVVDLPVEPFVRAVGREHRADGLPRRHLAVLAEHRAVD